LLHFLDCSETTKAVGKPAAFVVSEQSRKAAGFPTAFYASFLKPVFS
jgi:hypothetical protein